MIKKLAFTACLLLFISLHSLAQSSIYALKWDYSSKKFELVSFNSQSWVEQSLVSNLNFTPLAGITKSVLNPFDNTYNVLSFSIGGLSVDDSLKYMDRRHLLSINTNTNAIDTIEVDSLILTLDYSCTENAFYYLAYDYNTKICELHRLSPGSWTDQLIDTVAMYPVWNSSDYPQQTAFDPFKKHLYVHGYPTHSPTGSRHLYTIDVTTGNIVDDEVLLDPNAFHQLAFSVTDSALWGIKVDFTPNERSMVAVDPGTWTTTPVSANVHDCWYINSQPVAVSEDGKHYFFVGLDDLPNTGYRINDFDLTTGTRSFSPVFADQNIHQIAVQSGACLPQSTGGSSIPDCETSFAFHANSGELLVKGPAQRGNLQVFDLKGRLMFTQRMNGESTLEIPGLRPGIYIVLVEGTSCSSRGKILVGP